MRTFTLTLIMVVGLSAIASAQSEKATQSKSANLPFTLSISSEPVFALGSRIEVKVRLTNTSGHKINGSTGTIKGFGYNYIYDVRDQSGNKVQEKEIDATHQGSTQISVLQPGQSRDEETNISEAFDLWPGRYTIQLSMRASYEPGAEVVKSNRITITVNP